MQFSIRTDIMKKRKISVHVPVTFLNQLLAIQPFRYNQMIHLLCNITKIFKF